MALKGSAFSFVIAHSQHPPCFRENLFALICPAGERLFLQSFTWSEAGNCNTYRLKPDSLGGFVYLFPNKSSSDTIPRIYYCLNVSFMLLLRNTILPDSFNFISLLCVSVWREVLCSCRMVKRGVVWIFKVLSMIKSLVCCCNQ